MSIEISNNVVIISIAVIVLIVSISMIIYNNFYMGNVLKIIDTLNKIPCTNELELEKLKCIRDTLKDLKNPIKQIRKALNKSKDE